MIVSVSHLFPCAPQPPTIVKILFPNKKIYSWDGMLVLASFVGDRFLSAGIPQALQHLISGMSIERFGKHLILRRDQMDIKADWFY